MAFFLTASPEQGASKPEGGIHGDSGGVCEENPWVVPSPRRPKSVSWVACVGFREVGGHHDNLWRTAQKQEESFHMTTIPTLVTDRLSLRPMRADDWPAYHRLMVSDRSVYMGGPFSEAVAWGMFCADHAQWCLFSCGALMIENRADAGCLGQVGINSGPLFPEFELGWFLYPEAEGQGFAHEAAVAMRIWSLRVRHIDTLVSYVDPGNRRSSRLAERLGARLDHDARRPDPSGLVYRHYG
jgi:RimJ/RimL family protein N-acetyltransferase